MWDEPNMQEQELFTKYDSTKPRASLIDFECIEQLSMLLERGATKYSVGNWRKASKRSTYFNACIRHLAFSFWGGKQNIDKETGVSHLICAMANIMFLYVLYRDNLGTDDR